MAGVRDGLLALAEEAPDALGMLLVTRKTRAGAEYEYGLQPIAMRLGELLGNNVCPDSAGRLLFNRILEILRGGAATLNPVEGENALLCGWNVFGCDEAVAWTAGVFAYYQDRQWL